MMTLDELKRFTEAHLKDELKIMETVLLIEKKDAEDFTQWYKSHPYCRGIDEIRRLVGKRTRDREDSENCQGLEQPICEKHCD
jgi:hypothetical protein